MCYQKFFYRCLSRYDAQEAEGIHLLLAAIDRPIQKLFKKQAAPLPHNH